MTKTANTEERTGLSGRERDFCLAYARLPDPRAAAYKAGWRLRPERAGERLLEREDIRKNIRRLTRSGDGWSSAAARGLGRLAFGNCADAVRLILAGETDELDPESLDLFNVAEIRKQKGGGVEIKFFDRIKALNSLAQMTQSGTDTLAELISSLGGADT